MRMYPLYTADWCEPISRDSQKTELGNEKSQLRQLHQCVCMDADSLRHSGQDVFVFVYIIGGEKDV